MIPAHGRSIALVVFVVLAVVTGAPAEDVPGEQEPRPEESFLPVPDPYEMLDRVLSELDYSRGSPGETDGSALFTDVTSEERNLAESLPRIASRDSSPSAFGTADGQVCVLAAEGFTLRALHSDDEGETFPSEVDVLGPPAQDEVLAYRAVDDGVGGVYVAAVIADASTGGFGLRFIRSDDMCATWTAPLTVLGPGQPVPDFLEFAIDAASDGVTAILYLNGEQESAYVSVSSDRGDHWGEPAAVFPPGGEIFPILGDVAVAPGTGNIHVSLAVVDSVGWTLYTIRSANHGVTFESPVDHRASFLPIALVLRNDIEIALDGSVLVAAMGSDSINSDDVLVVLRSTDQGQSFTRSSRARIGRFDGAFLLNSPHLTVGPDTSDVLASMVSRQGELWVLWFSDHGSGLTDSSVLADDAVDTPVYHSPVTRTFDGRWSVVWASTALAAGDHRTDVFAAFSSVGLNFGAPQRLNAIAASPVNSAEPVVAPSGADGAFAVFTDTRPAGGLATDLYAARATAGSDTFDADYRIDTDAGTIRPPAEVGPLVHASDDGYVYVAFTTGNTIFFRSSSDRGETFSPAVVVSSMAADLEPQALGSDSEGRVYLAYGATSGTAPTDLRVACSGNRGATWTSPDVLLGTDLFRRAVLATVPGGKVHVAWSDLQEIYLSSSFDGGASFTTQDVDQNSTNSDQAPSLCAQDNQILLGWAGRNPANTSRLTAQAVTSDDEGATWSPSANLRASAGPDSPSSGPRIACNGHGEAVAVWPDYRPGSGGQVFASHFDGTSWSVDAPASPSGIRERPQISYVDPDGEIAVIVYQVRTDSAIFASRSMDGGRTFDTFQRVDDTAPDPSAASAWPRIASDGLGGIWLSWRDASAGDFWSIAVTRSTDAGSTYDGVLRVNRELPQGLFNNGYSFFNEQVSEALPGRGLFVWRGVRDTPFFESLFNFDDPDFVPPSNTPPEADAGPDETAECSGPSGTAVQLDGSASSDPDSSPGSNDDIQSFDWFEDLGLPSETPLGSGEFLQVSLSPGGHTITLRVTDSAGETAFDEVIKTVVDTMPPDVSVSVDPSLLWPPNHRLVEVTATATAMDTCGSPAVVLESITSDESDNAPQSTDGDTNDDIQDAETGTPDFEFALRAERDGSGDGRTYTIVYTATDAAGNAASATAEVDVPHDLSGIMEPLLITLHESASGTIIGWTEVEGAVAYSVIRRRLSFVRVDGPVIELGSGICVEGASQGTTTVGWEDDDVPPTGEAFVYLVEYDDGRPSSYGTESAPKPRTLPVGDDSCAGASGN